MSVTVSKQSLIKAGVLAAGLLAFSQGAMAQIDGVYHSDAGDYCVLTIS